jgi:signal transduction histidine kinase/CheY-like chemotaxis protein
MSLSPPKTIRLLLMEIRLEHDVVLCRQRARQFAAALGFSSQEQIGVATALSEIARNAFQYAGGGKVEFSFETEARYASPAKPRQSLVIDVRDTGPGIAVLDELLAGRYQSRTGLGLGILGAQRLMSEVNIDSSPAGTRITLRQVLHQDRPTLELTRVQAIVDEILRQAPVSALEEMQVQNHELIQAIDSARTREEEIGRINHELGETNSGVLALYDELETLHRVSMLLASQLDLKALIQSIIDVTTDLTNADLGAFYFVTEGGESWNLYATAGPSSAALAHLGPEAVDHPFGPEFGRKGMVLSHDLQAEPATTQVAQFARALAGRLTIRACLTIPVSAANGSILGAMVFAAADSGRFTERSERIVTSIATQAVVGIEKSRLFHAVKASSEAKDQFLAMLSHELRTPLNPVLAIISSWQNDQRIPEELREEVAVIARNVRLEARLIDDLLDFNKLINGKLQIDSAPVEMNGVVETVVEICRADFEAATQLVSVKLTAVHSTVTGDVARLQQVLWNVLKNAIKFTPKDGRITLETSNPTPEILRVAVTDTGRGIEPEALLRIFGAFEQGQPQVLARFGGLGLGLAIAKTFVERHGGTITATSAGLGQGASIILDLPVSTPSPQQSLNPLPPITAPAASKGARILLIDDHADTLSALARLLKRKGHTITPAPTGAAAREEFTRGEFDLIISDLGLPDCSGLDLITDLRAIRTVPAIALSGYGMETDLLSSKAAGFDEHLTKPIDFEHLLRTVDRLVGS